MQGSVKESAKIIIKKDEWYSIPIEFLENKSEIGFSERTDKNNKGALSYLAND